MKHRDSFWQQLSSLSLSRRQALRAAVLGAAGILLTRPVALAQSAPAPVVPGSPEAYVLHLTLLPPDTIPAQVIAFKGNQKTWPVLQGVSVAQVGETLPGDWIAFLATRPSGLPA